ncbi:MAG TPA: hypothetical protein VK737_01055 [Opitutales bacterium]|jgi:hypothetical protein|nr:hypothetical protein [Opitutales bacterium]
MKTAKSAALLIVLGACLAGCSSTDANGVDVSRPTFFNFLQSPPVAVPVSPFTPDDTAATPQVPGGEYSVPAKVL